MNYEKKYKEALERARKLYEQGTITESLCYVFPELKESEDEMIRKSLINYFRCIAKNGDTVWTNLDYDKVIAWLEKHKPVIVPKFKVGDTIRFKGNETLKSEEEIHKIIDYDNELYVFDDGTTDLFCEQNLYELVEQKSVECGEEDEKMLDNIIKDVMTLHNSKTIDGLKCKVNWLKSFRPQKQWKPSDEQMQALSEINLTGYISYPGQGQELINLYNDLKKLKG